MEVAIHVFLTGVGFMTAIFKLLQSASCSKGEHHVPLYATYKQKRYTKKAAKFFSDPLDPCLTMCAIYFTSLHKRLSEPLR